MQEKLVSIILPVYNVEKYIEKCIKSILNQDYKNFEAIFVNDGSTDNCEKILDQYSKKDKRIKVFNKKNGGVSSAKNLGLEKAKGEYITFVDPDDYIEKDYLTYLIKLIEENDADIALSLLYKDNYDDKQITNDTIKEYDSKTALIEILNRNINVGVWEKMFITNLIDENKIKFDETMSMGEGFDFNCHAFSCANKIMAGKRKIYYYTRDNENSATTKFNFNKWKNAIDSVDKMKKYLNTNDKKIYKSWLFTRWRTNVDAFTLIKITHNERNDYNFYKMVKKYSRKYFYLPFYVNSSLNDKIRGICLLICPSLLPKLLLLRRKIHKVNIRN